MIAHFSSDGDLRLLRPPSRIKFSISLRSSPFAIALAARRLTSLEPPFNISNSISIDFSILADRLKFQANKAHFASHVQWIKVGNGSSVNQLYRRERLAIMTTTMMKLDRSLVRTCGSKAHFKAGDRPMRLGRRDKAKAN